MCVFYFLLFSDIFCFKQKTAYEMRISDWGSDVCSSDLCRRAQNRCHRNPAPDRDPVSSAGVAIPVAVAAPRATACSCHAARRTACRHRSAQRSPRSEEHTSELQSLMRISYAVFCLKKKKKITTYPHITTNTIEHTSAT